jgi:hypothetical protein
MTITEAAKTIRADLKAAGIPARSVSVSSTGGAINVVIKAADVDFSLVERIATRQSQVSRDEDGEILAGGNRFVFVRFDDRVISDVAAGVVLGVDDCFVINGRQAFPLFDRDQRVGFHLDGWKGMGRLTSVRDVVWAAMTE